MNDQSGASRLYPLRKPKGFEPTVQRWSVALPTKHRAYFVEFLGVQGTNIATVDGSPFFGFINELLARPDAPDVVDHARHEDENGMLNHIVAGYWIDENAHESWSSALKKSGFWNAPARLTDACGIFRESLCVPVDGQETLYWRDYPAGLSRSENVGLYPTPYCGYFGAMRDRIPLSAIEKFPSPAGDNLAPPARRAAKGARWRVNPPENLAVIRSGTFWGRCDAEQREDFETKLRKPLEMGMGFLKDNPVVTGCCALRYQQTVDTGFCLQPEAHALGYFLSISHLEDWAERHASHHAIFAAAMARYKKYGSSNQLRTWHEVFILPANRQTFEYINCTPETGLLPWFDATCMEVA